MAELFTEISRWDKIRYSDRTQRVMSNVPKYTGSDAYRTSRAISAIDTLGAPRHSLVRVNIDAIRQERFGVLGGANEPASGKVELVSNGNLGLVLMRSVVDGGGELTMAAVAGGFAGTLLHPEGGVRVFRPVDNKSGIHVMLEFGESGDDECHVRESGTSGLASATLEDDRVNVLGVRNSRTMDTLVVYTAQAEAALGTSLLGHVQVAVQNANAAMNFSGQEGAFYLSRVQRIDGIPDGSTADQILDALIVSETVRRLVEQHQPDLVQVVVNRFSDGGAGIGEQPGQYSAVTTAGVVALSAGHELYHNLGLAHNVEHVGGAHPADRIAYGYRDIDRRLRCIMSYDGGLGLRRLARVANPAVDGFGISGSADARGMLGRAIPATSSRRTPTRAPQPSADTMKYKTYLPVINR